MSGRGAAAHQTVDEVLAVTGFQASTLSYRDGFLFVGLVTLVTLILGLFIAGRRRKLAAGRA